MLVRESPSGAALKAPVDISPGQRPGFYASFFGAPRRGARNPHTPIPCKKPRIGRLGLPSKHGDRVGRRGGAAFEDHRYRAEHKVITAFPSSFLRQLFKDGGVYQMRPNPNHGSATYP